jgi:hypothetical protein
MDETIESDEPPEDAPSESLRPYEPPAIAWQEGWDVRANLASACAKRSGDGDPCPLDVSS